MYKRKSVSEGGEKKKRNPANYAGRKRREKSGENGAEMPGEKAYIESQHRSVDRPFLSDTICGKGKVRTNVLHLGGEGHQKVRRNIKTWGGESPKS